MKIFTAAFLLIISLTAAAAPAIPLAPVNFQISASQALSKFEAAIFHPEGVLRRFRPAGVRVSNLDVSGNELSFTATKTVLVVTKSVYVHGVFQASEASRGCAREELGYVLRMHFQGSGRLVTDNVQELRALVCLRDSGTKITGKVNAQIIKGARYSSTLGPMAVNLIRDQVNPLLNALTEEIKAMR